MVKGRRGSRGLAVAVTVCFVLLTFAGAVRLTAGALAIPSVVHHPDATDTVMITVGDFFSFSPNTFTVNPGDTVHLTVVQTGSTAHTFTLSSVANYTLTASNTTLQLEAFFAAHKPLVNLTIPGTAGAQVPATFTAPSKGSYQFVCLQAGHFQAGMEGAMGSGVSVTVQLPNTGPGAPVFIIGGTIVGLVVAAIVLGFVVGRRRGAVHEMPPERLGYPEPADTRPSQAKLP